MVILNPALENALSKSIDQICDGKFHAFSHNHCAHFVSHVAGLEFPFNCKQFKGGQGAPANVRVHEVFSQCPLVGRWDDADKNVEQLVFVTKISNVDLTTKTMVNVPQKHIGIFSEGFVYHYSNSQNKVVKWSPEVFLEKFDAIYRGVQGLFFGTLPGSDLNLHVQPQSDDVTRGLGFGLNKEGKQWFADPNGNVAERFYVGRETSNGNFIGLFLRPSEYYGPVFRAVDYVDRIDHWAQLLELTGHCESANRFNLINTYDSAKFTFGFYQLAAHTANDNLVLLFRALASLPEFADYFPELKLINDRLHRVDEDGSTTNLEVEMPTGPNGRRQPQHFMNFLNAKRREHDMQEVLQSARIMHWANNHETQRDMQVAVSFDILQRKMATTYQRRYELDGQPDTICAVIADIHHQGRASRTRVAAALESAAPLENLIEVNPRFSNRNAALREKLGQMVADGHLGTKHYDAALNEFT